MKFGEDARKLIRHGQTFIGEAEVISYLESIGDAAYGMEVEVKISDNPEWIRAFIAEAPGDDIFEHPVWFIDQDHSNGGHGEGTNGMAYRWHLTKHNNDTQAMRLI